ncbi:HET-domain-containing protein [Hyaloscypha variabilis F]|uniref:HET-domain-containing protein n=1 Tax=Hyaloscypha variabilis (strain UAMH 11265 / GT02V1 / F) TaxID=1149755 RepID=A0A2J6R7R1_HYAVF|nr:HET-domain-containing protein [Hyaloscypha variabilis F]
MFSKSHSIVLQGTRTRPIELSWWYSSSDRTEGNPVHDLRLGIDLFTTKVKCERLSFKNQYMYAGTLTSGDTSSDASLQWALSRLEKCTTHTYCGPAQRTPLPTRVLDIGTNNNDIKLYETENESDYYIALSHCWGDSRTTTTTSETLAKHMQLIAWKSLAKTFQDSVTMVRKLGLRYFWIDSLCIIQDDPDDWSKESGKMANVYQGAFLTIAATKSSSDDGGLFSTASPNHLARELRPRVYARQSLPHSVKWSKGYDFKYSNKFPLFIRAWCYQESLLSSRVLHFAANELMWDCREKFYCEGSCHEISIYGRDRPPFPKSDHAISLNLPLELWNRWWRIVEEYSGLDLSQEKDKFPALSGLAKQVQAVLKARYLAGLWESNLFFDLLWKSHKRTSDAWASDRSGRCLPWRAPTWSWASVRGKVGWSYDIICYARNRSAFTVKILAGLVEASCVPAGADVTGELSSGYLVLSGQMFSTRCLVSLGDDGDFRYVLEYLDHLGFKGRYKLAPDIPLHEAMVKPGLELHCLAIALIHEPLPRGGIIQYFLVLVKSKVENGAYERVGLLDTYRQPFMKEYWACSKAVVVKIV